jgi:hypothetical protein
MNSDRGKTIWKRVRFWGGVFLIIVVGIALLFWHSYRKSLGPPPTPPGKSPEFDQHLADIDEKWLFLFEVDDELVLSNIYGNDDTKLATSLSGGLVDRRIVRAVGFSSPEGNLVAVLSRAVATKGSGVFYPYVLSLVDRRKGESETVNLPGRQYEFWEPFDIFWLSNKSFITRVASRITPGSGARFRDVRFDYLRLDIDGSPTWREVHVPTSRQGPFSPGTGGSGSEKSGNVLVTSDSFPLAYFNTDSLTLVLCLYGVDGTATFCAYDEDGMRQATPEEKARFVSGSELPGPFEEFRSRDVPQVRTSKHEKDDSFRRLLMRFGLASEERWEFRLDGEIVRLAQGPHGPTREPYVNPTWDEELGLFVWRETDPRKNPLCYYMDTEGHYRLWHKGRYLGKFRRRQGQSEEAEE